MTYYYYPPNTSRTQGPLIVSTLFGVLALVSFAARLYSLRLRNEGPRLEEWLLVGALVLTYVSLGLQWVFVTLGGTGRHLSDVEQASATLTLQLLPPPLPLEALYGLTLMLVKFSMHAALLHAHLCPEPRVPVVRAGGGPAHPFLDGLGPARGLSPVSTARVQLGYVD